MQAKKSDKAAGKVPKKEKVEKRKAEKNALEKKKPVRFYWFFHYFLIDFLLVFTIFYWFSIGFHYFLIDFLLLFTILYWFLIWFSRLYDRRRRRRWRTRSMLSGASSIIKNDELYIKNDGLCIKMMNCALKMMDFAFKMMNFAARTPTSGSSPRRGEPELELVKWWIW